MDLAKYSEKISINCCSRQKSSTVRVSSVARKEDLSLGVGGLKALGAVVIGLVMALAPVLNDQCFGITCSECLEIDRQENLIQTELNKLTKDLKEAFNNSRFNKVTQIRGQVNGLRKKLLELKRRGQDCSTACRPEEIKSAECHNLKLKIRDLEASPDSDDATVDRLYRDLVRCNNELSHM